MGTPSRQAGENMATAELHKTIRELTERGVLSNGNVNHSQIGNGAELVAAEFYKWYKRGAHKSNFRSIEAYITAMARNNHKVSPDDHTFGAHAIRAAIGLFHLDVSLEANVDPFLNYLERRLQRGEIKVRDADQILALCRLINLRP